MGRVSDKRKSSGRGQSSPLRNSSNSDILRPASFEYESGSSKKMKIDNGESDCNNGHNNGDEKERKTWARVTRGALSSSSTTSSSVPASGACSEGSVSSRSRTSSRASMSSEDTNKSDISSLTRSPRTQYEVETDPAVLARRQKQIEYGKNTLEYHNYIQAIPKEERRSFHPKTPPMRRKYSRRAWDGLIKQWRLNLHIWTDPTQGKKSDEESEATAKAEPKDDKHKDDSDNSDNNDSTSKDEVKYLSWSEEVEEYEEELKNVTTNEC